ncbi:hypothetical protein Leryth_000385 [Lithospermum erythrorhizon]|nr:hypothetical protein Leryth_000385 [Lithospermum erythrorhizon]
MDVDLRRGVVDKVRGLSENGNKKGDLDQNRVMIRRSSYGYDVPNDDNCDVSSPQRDYYSKSSSFRRNSYGGGIDDVSLKEYKGVVGLRGSRFELALVRAFGASMVEPWLATHGNPSR